MLVITIVLIFNQVPNNLQAFLNCYILLTQLRIIIHLIKLIN